MYNVEDIQIIIPNERLKLQQLYKQAGLIDIIDCERYIGIYDGDKLIAAGGINNNIIKGIAIDKDYQNRNLTSTIITELNKIQLENGNSDYFVFTKPSNVNIFKSMGFYEISKYENHVSLLTRNISKFNDYLDNLKKYKKNYKNIGAIVINGNPPTLGHKYLIDYAKNDCDYLHIFVVSEEKSSFPSHIRKELIKKIANSDKISVHEGGEYIISSSTFPTYFLKEDVDANEIYAGLDATIFLQHIAKVLNINKRYVGHEPFCSTTSTYNNVMKSIFKDNIQLIEIKRLKENNNYISASAVRNAIREDNIALLKDYLPKETYDFIMSDSAKEIINNIKSSKTRH